VSSLSSAQSIPQNTLNCLLLWHAAVLFVLVLTARGTRAP
jgi:hypothetical protein